MHRSRLKIEDKELDFEFEIVNVQFNEVGQYSLRLTVENPLLEGSGVGVRLRVNNGDLLSTNTGSTDIIAQTNVNEIHSVLKKKFVFRLPKGYCQNDKNHDVRLRIEAFRLIGSPLKSVKEGEAFFAIYPRTNAPRINVFAKEHEDFYCYSNTLALLRVQGNELAMHCGRMACNVSFHQVRLPQELGPRSDSSPLLSKEGGHTHLLTPSSTQEVPPPFTASPRQWAPTPTPHSPNPQSELVEDTNPNPSPEASEESLPPGPVEGHTIRQRLPSDCSFHLSSAEHTPAGTPEALPGTHVTETPPGRTEPTLTSPTNDEHVSRPGKESISIILHGATDLPALGDGSVPQPFGIAKSGSDVEKQQRAQGITHASAQPTHSPSWEEKVSVEIDEENAKDEVVVLNIADSRTKELLASYRVPVTYLQMFHHYHIELIQPHPGVPSGVRLYITIVRKGCIIPRQEDFAFTGFEVLLRAVENPLKDPVGPLLAVARIVPDYESYKDAILMKTPWLAGISTTTIKYPSLHRSLFDVLHHTSQGHPQVSHAGIPQEQPIWDYSFLFQGRDCATIFTAGAALVIEYYSITTVMNTVSWYIRSPLGFSVVPLAQGVFHKLMAESGGRGLRLDGLPVQGHKLRTTSNTNPTVGLILRLIGSERPDSILAATNPGHLHTLDSKSVGSSQHQTATATRSAANPEISSERHLSNMEEWAQLSTSDGAAELTTPHYGKLQQDRVSLPPYDALAQILPEYDYLFRSPHPKERPERPQSVRAPRPLPTRQAAAPSEKRELTIEDRAVNQEIIHHETKELDNYRAAMQKMAEDIIKLRKDIARLEVENSKLRSELSSHQDLGRTLLDNTDIDVMTQAEIADRIVLLRQKLTTETAEVLSCKDKVQQLQNELIRKNDREAELLRLQKAHQQQQAVLQKYQEKMHKSKILEDTIRQQEKVIERMESLLDKKLKEIPREKPNASKNRTGFADDSLRKEVESVLLAENARLRDEIGTLRHQPAPIILQQPVLSVKESLSDMDKLSLLAKLEKAQSRIQTLETLKNPSDSVLTRNRRGMHDPLA
ncbi:coiled-coil domain-containing protein 33 isoform X2 [Scyliorhinus torazame]|uniref:coiled-coil domain-containing protein 33 isoform X2 n=1 Tax=Scyliorhinus torazame TaxID=75743 RepID=UPI003B59CACB